LPERDGRQAEERGHQPVPQMKDCLAKPSDYDDEKKYDKNYEFN
jgi:hypothetical protein